MDNADIAQTLIEERRQRALDNARSALPTHDSLEFCEDCDVGIPEARRKAVAGVTTCIDCASFRELQDQC